MPLGTERDISTVNQGDTADLYAYVMDQDSNPIPAADIASVSFVIQAPDGTKTTTAGTVEPDGAGFLRYDTVAAQIGEYIAMVQFTLDSGEKRSTRVDFAVIDPFDPPVPSGIDVLVDTTWLLLEDCFDSEEGGPWLRDMTLSYFSKEKIAAFIPFALLDINMVQPPTQLAVADFTTVQNDGAPDPDMAVLAYGTLIQVIRHLMRSYVEQPANMGSEIAFEDRRDYLQRWQLIIQDLQPEYLRLVTLWKRQFLHLGKSALSVHSKAGRLYGTHNGSWRMRNAGRGWY